MRRIIRTIGATLVVAVAMATSATPAMASQKWIMDMSDYIDERKDEFIGGSLGD